MKLMRWLYLFPLLIICFSPLELLGDSDEDLITVATRYETEVLYADTGETVDSQNVRLDTTGYIITVKVLETKQPMDLEPQSPWQRRIVHMTISEMDGVESESAGEGRDRHIVIKPVK